MLELGSGRSTLWYAKRSASVTSFEDDPHWAQRARQMLLEAGIDHAEVREMPVEAFRDAVAAFPEECFDLVVVDFLESPDAERPGLVKAARSKVRIGGYMLLDDSDRPAYAPAYEHLTGWREHRFTGVKDGWPTVSETAIFRRPRASRPTA